MSRKNSVNQVKVGAMLSYLLIILNTIYGLLISPYILGRLGIQNNCFFLICAVGS